MGWDIGGANLKAVRLSSEAGMRIVERPFELWREPQDLTARLVEIAREVETPRRHALTMTAELADCYATKREGVWEILESFGRALPGEEVRIFTTRGAFSAAGEAQRAPLEVAGANWCASATWLARASQSGVEGADVVAWLGRPDPARAASSGPTILVDVGSTTTDIVPFGDGRVLARARTDPERLLAGELVYTGSLRTPLCAILTTAPLNGGECPVAAESFAIAADAHLWLGSIREAEYTCPTPDSGPATRAGAAARLARVVCADVEMLTEEEIGAIARRAADAQVESIARAIAQVAARLASQAPAGSVLTAGSGAWLAEEAARRCGLAVEPLSERLGEASRVLPAFAVAALLMEAVHG